MIQPFLFAASISLKAFRLPGIPDWSVLYLISAAIGLASFLIIANLRRIRETLRLPATEEIGWIGILSRVAFCVSFPLFFQLELILCGRLSTVNVGVYAMLQKLYASISISLFGAIGVHLLAKHMDENTGRGRLVDRELVWIAMASSLCTPLVGFAVLFFTHGGKGLNGRLVLASAVVSFLYTVCALAGLRLSALRPVLGLEFFAVSMALYLAGFVIMRPETAARFLFLASLFFGVFFCLLICEDRFRLFEKVMPWRRQAWVLPSRQRSESASGTSAEPGTD